MDGVLLNFWSISQKIGILDIYVHFYFLKTGDLCRKPDVFLKVRKKVQSFSASENPRGSNRNGNAST